VLFPAPISDDGNLVPSVIGQPYTSAEETLQAAGFRVRREAEVPHPTAPGGVVVWQDPPPEMRLPASAVVRLTVSTGPEALVVPDVVNLDLDLASSVLREAGFRVGSIDSVASLSVPGTVLATRPGLGVVRRPGEEVTLVVSRGPADIQVPALRGLTRDQAADRLEALGLRMGYVRLVDQPGAQPGVVLEQRPSPGVRLPRRSRVDLTLVRTP
jgi:serine/threonine-protein kinase